MVWEGLLVLIGVVVGGLQVFLAVGSGSGGAAEGVLLDFAPECFDFGVNLGFDEGELVVCPGGGSCVVAVGGEVVFDFWFGARAADDDLGAVLEAEGEHEFFGQLVAVGVVECVHGVVCCFDDGRADEGGRRAGGVAFEEGFDFGCAFGAFHDELAKFFAVVAQVAVDVVEVVEEGLAAGVGFGKDVDEHDGGGVGVFVAHGVGAAVAVAFFAAEDEVGAVAQLEVAALFGCECPVVGAGDGFEDGVFVAFEFLADVFEAGEGVDEFDAEFLCDAGLEFGGDEGFYEAGAGFVGVVEGAVFEELVGAEVGEDGADLVAGEEFELAIGAAHGDAHAVGVGVGAEHKRGANFFCQCDAQGKSLAVFGVGGFDGGEVAVGGCLLGDDLAFYAQFLEHGRDGAPARAVDGGEDDLGQGGFFRAQRVGEWQGEEHLLVGVVDVRAECDGARAIGGGGVGGDLGLRSGGDDAGGFGFDELCAVVEVGFVAVVVWGVVAGGDDDAGLGAEVAHGKGEHGCGAGIREDVGVEALVVGNAGSEEAEFAGEVADVVCDDDGAFFAGEAGSDVAAEAAGGTLDVGEVHHVGADGGFFGAGALCGGTAFGAGNDFADGASAQAAGAEGKSAEEAVVEFGPGFTSCEFFNDLVLE